VLAGAVLAAAAAAFLLATGDRFSAAFVLALAVALGVVAERFRRNPHLLDCEYFTATLTALASTAARGGRVAQEDADAVHAAEERARARASAATDPRAVR
jgi:hypothetical protein